MDPDIPHTSIEQDALPNINTSSHSPASPSIHINPFPRSHLNSAASVPLPPSSPMRTPHHTPIASKQKSLSPKPPSRPPSRSPSVASSYRGEKQSTPTLATRRSTSSLSTTRGGTPQYQQYRRTSSNLNPSSPATNGRVHSGNLSERSPVTASSVAKDYFGREMEAHAFLQSPVVVMVHDSCYGHRFSRPRSTKNALATIVERPERIHAALLGASAAYVRLGGRHAEGEYAPRPMHHSSHVRNIPFQIRKTSRNIPLTHPSVAFVHGSKWMEELQIMCDTAEGKLALNGKELVRPVGYGKDENGDPLPKLHEGDLYLCAESLAAFQGCLGGVCDAIDTVFSSGVTNRAFVCIRPPGHHCSSNFPSGFCWLNNVHVGIAYGAMNHGLTHAAIIDFDLHHGDGSQNIAWDHNCKAQGAAKNAAAHKKTPIGYYSLHDINSYPCEWGDEEKVRNASVCIENAHGQSIWNVHLEPWKSHEEFWKLYEAKYTILLEKARIFLRSHTARLLRASGNQQPKAAIFISAGFDASEWEGAGMQRHSVNVPTEFYARFTANIVRLAHEDDLGVDGRIVSVLEGGYSDRALTSGALSHICGLAGDANAANTGSLSTPEATKFPTINNWVPPDMETSAKGPNISYSADWWTSQNLEELEAVVAGRQPPPPKSLKDKTGNYSSPTHASTLKMTDHARERQSLSALQARLSLESEYVPPPPEVDWAIASYELSRVIIPGDRQTLSCTHEELNVDATKARRERPSTASVAAAPDERMQLRGRRAKAQPTGLVGVRASSRNENRRTTIAAISDLPDPTMQHHENVNGRARRRSSDASSILSGFQAMKLSDETDGANKTGNIPSRTPSTVPEKPPKAVAVKKTRAPTTKAPVKPKTSPRKPKSTSPVAIDAPKPGLSTHVGDEQSESDKFKREPTTTSQEGSNVASKADDMENLTNGMKKISIKLKMPSAEEHAARQQQKAIEDKQKKGRVSRKPLLAKNTKVVKAAGPADQDRSVHIQPKPMPSEGQEGPESTTDSRTTVLEAENTFGRQGQAGSAILNNSPEHQASSHSGPDVRPPEVSQTAFGDVQITTPNMSDPVITDPAPSTQGDVVDPLPPASMIPSTDQQTLSQPLNDQMPQMSAESTQVRPTSARNVTPKRTKQDLPVFDSNSPIPFAAPVSAYINNPNQDQDVNHQHSIRDILETAQQN
ncbi:uncharacterized protein Z518_08804 [Rhinocladiella mackenziei CBS 650.93]|uniref:Histone deacetylase domain-containing protein n=1 Tax=Rhinocladiella mackenziei CBS 650.93 TaxID=1442369 RepID=A0A0D2IHT1_9EURO|nr:uncharacterized protein Z518_08804 [Rhinocladiella mackenziei CBS 650.93]KIX02861.1 hypothetical protein Z518_08804 [Rhinocladiella mackenziei CBS 650.93]